MALPLPPSRPAALWPRIAVFLLGIALLGLGAFAVFEVSPADLNPEPGEQATVTERVSYWTPEEGHQTDLRPRSTSIHAGDGSLELVRELRGPHSPRGAHFTLELADRYELADQPRAYATFPPTPLWNEPPETVHLGIPWSTDRGVQVGAFDDFHRLHEVQRDKVTLVKYQVSEPNQFFVPGDTAWFRSIERTALVEPISGTVVDYEETEILWTSNLDRPGILNLVDPPSQNREKVWEATVEPTSASSQALLERAQHQRAEQIESLLWAGLPFLGAGEILVGAALLGRPRGLLGPRSSAGP